MTHLKTFALFILCAIGSQTGNAAKPEPSGMPMPPPVSAPSPCLRAWFRAACGRGGRALSGQHERKRPTGG